MEANLLFFSKEGAATMSLLSSRHFSRTIVLLSLAIFVFLFLSLPVPSSVSKRTGVGPAIVWAGSPDETLAPDPTAPPKRASRIIQRPTGTSGVSARILFAMLWRYWTAVRF